MQHHAAGRQSNVADRNPLPDAQRTQLRLSRALQTCHSTDETDTFLSAQIVLRVRIGKLGISRHARVMRQERNHRCGRRQHTHQASHSPQHSTWCAGGREELHHSPTRQLSQQLRERGFQSLKALRFQEFVLGDSRSEPGSSSWVSLTQQNQYRPGPVFPLRLMQAEARRLHSRDQVDQDRRDLRTDDTPSFVTNRRVEARP